MAASMEHVEEEKLPVPSEEDPPEHTQPVTPEDTTTQPAVSLPDEQDEDDEGDEEPREPRVRDTPEDIRLEAAANTLAFHPSRDLVAMGDLDGDIYAFTYSCTEGENREVWSSGHHMKACRALSFSQDGQKLVSVSRDKSIHILDAETGRLVSRVPKAHAVPINSLLLVDENILATGDDEGTLKVWDMRKGSSFMDMKHHEDYISGIAIDQAKKTLLTSSGDGTMGVFNIKRRRFDLVSEYQSGDLTCVSLMKRGRKVVCGSSEGTIYIFNWDGFGATSDRFALKAESIDCIVPITDSILCGASVDGVIRAINILPNRVIGSIGQHVGEPIEQIAKSADGRFLASCAHDELVKFWDISSLATMTVSDYRKRKKKDGRLKALSKKAHGTDDFFSGLVEPEKKEEEGGGEEEEEEEEDIDSDSD